MHYLSAADCSWTDDAYDWSGVSHTEVNKKQDQWQTKAKPEIH